MPSAIEQIVEAYVQLGSRSQLEDLRLHRQRLIVDLQADALWAEIEAIDKKLKSGETAWDREERRLRAPLHHAQE